MQEYKFTYDHSHTEFHRNGSTLYEVVLHYPVEIAYQVRGHHRTVISVSRDGLALDLPEYALYDIFGGPIESDYQRRKQETPAMQAA